MPKTKPSNPRNITLDTSVIQIASDALTLSIERLEINNCERSEQEFIEIVTVASIALKDAIKHNTNSVIDHQQVIHSGGGVYIDVISLSSGQKIYINNDAVIIRNSEGRKISSTIL